MNRLVIPAIIAAVVFAIAASSLYTVSEHVIRPYTYRQVVTNLDRMLAGLVLVRPEA